MNTKKNIAVALATLGTSLAVLPLFAAFEAHVINVTAKIENALKVDPQILDFGTVFPQEHLEKPISIELSQSFKDEGRVDDVEYFIRQKPKCAITWDNGTEFDKTLAADGKTHAYTGTGHLVLNNQNEWVVDCGPTPRTLDTGKGEVWGPLPNLCPYLSKHSEVVRTGDNGTVYEDGSLASFHKPWITSSSSIQWTDVLGRLAKSENDFSDTWTIDLAVPCFGGYCAQDWADFVHKINKDANPADYTQPIANEHKIYGCDLWVEVSGVSTKPEYNQCGTVLPDAAGVYPPTGEQTNPATYDYILTGALPTSGNAADHKWVHLPTRTSIVVWDMGAPTKAVYLVPSIDHGPVPQESKEATLWGSDTPTGPWEAGVETATYNDGPSTWISDDYATRWAFTKNYRYVKATAGGTLFDDGDAEIDTVCTAN